MQRILRITKNAAIVAGAILFLGLGIGTGVGAPDHAIVFIDPKNKVYLAPPCLEREKAETFSRMTIRAARKLNLTPDPTCRDASGFTQDGRSLTGIFLEKLGILGPLPTRWNADGSWNW